MLTGSRLPRGSYPIPHGRYRSWRVNTSDRPGFALRHAPDHGQATRPVRGSMWGAIHHRGRPSVSCPAEAGPSGGQDGLHVDAAVAGKQTGTGLETGPGERSAERIGPQLRPDTLINRRTSGWRRSPARWRRVRKRRDPAGRWPDPVPHPRRSRPDTCRRPTAYRKGPQGHPRR
jgi:hypothetical protein